jgi:hypothetical protein
VTVDPFGGRDLAERKAPFSERSTMTALSLTPSKVKSQSRRAITRELFLRSCDTRLRMVIPTPLLAYTCLIGANWENISPSASSRKHAREKGIEGILPMRFIFPAILTTLAPWQ